jgi:hypothetical protein
LDYQPQAYGIVRYNEEMNTMTKEKKTFAWDTILLIKEASGPMFVRGTDIEVEWCPITKMYWEI